jgi:predicted nucleic acid-binding protein
MLFLRPDVGAPAGVARALDRIAFLIDQLEKAKETLLIPTPALAEVLVRAGGGAADLIEKISKYAVFKIEPFDTRAAIEVAAMTRTAIDGGKKKASTVSTWAKLKYDRQIVAIAVVTQNKVIYSNDRDIRALAKKAKIECIGLADLPLPLEDPQLGLALEAPRNETNMVQQQIAKPVRLIESKKDDETPAG